MTPTRSPASQPAQPNNHPPLPGRRWGRAVAKGAQGAQALPLAPVIDGHCAQWKGRSALLACCRWAGWVPAFCGAARGEEGRVPLGPEVLQGGWEREPWLACPQTLRTLEQPSCGLPASEPLEGSGRREARGVAWRSQTGAGDGARRAGSARGPRGPRMAGARLSPRRENAKQSLPSVLSKAGTFPKASVSPRSL